MLSKIECLYKDIYELEKSYLNLVVDNSARLLYSEWVREPTSEEYREGAALFAECLSTMKIEYWIQDVNRLGKVSDSDLRWALQQLVSVTASSNLKKLARISSDESKKEHFMRLVGHIRKQYPTAIEVQQFESYREAAEWIWPMRD
jgi:hypothetical protein